MLQSTLIFGAYIFYAYWLNPYLLWDLLSIKRSAGSPAFVVHTHCSGAQLNGSNRLCAKELLRVNSLADSVVAPDEEMGSTAYWTSLIEGLEKGIVLNAPLRDRNTEALLDLTDWIYDSLLNSLEHERDQERDNARRLAEELGSLEAERKSWELERESLETERRFWEEELYATRKTVSYRTGHAITWLPRKLRGGIRCYREHGGKYTFYRLLYHLRLAPDNDDSGEA